MPREPSQVVGRLIGTEIIEQEKRIIGLGSTETDGAVEVYAGTLNSRATLDELANTPVLGHGLLRTANRCAGVVTFSTIVPAAAVSARSHDAKNVRGA
jgi:hypothetical protein